MAPISDCAAPIVAPLASRPTISKRMSRARQRRGVSLQRQPRCPPAPVRRDRRMTRAYAADGRTCRTAEISLRRHHANDRPRRVVEPSVRPIARRIAPNSRCQSESLIRATCRSALRVLGRLNVRPAMGLMPSSGSSSCESHAAPARAADRPGPGSEVHLVRDEPARSRPSCASAAECPESPATIPARASSPCCGRSPTHREPIGIRRTAAA